MKVYKGPYPEIEMLGYGARLTGRGYDDGLKEGERRGWNDAIEAAAEWLESQEGHGAHNRFAYAAAIRKLKKE